MKHAFTCALLASSLSFTASAADYVFDKDHTNIQFAVSHNGLSNFIGQFQGFEGKFKIDEKDLTASSFSVEIDADSIDTDVPALDKHLKQDDFLDVAKYPKLRFVSQGIRQVSSDKYAVTGELTMHGVTKPVTLDARLNFQGRHPLADFYDNYKTDYLGFSATTSINRSDFGISTFAPMLADQVEIRLEAELKKVVK